MAVEELYIEKRGSMKTTTEISLELLELDINQNKGIEKCNYVLWYFYTYLKHG